MINNLPKPSPSAFFSQKMATSYDEKNRRLSEISDNMHFLVRLILLDLSSEARILCVGVGTGAEILSLAKFYPDWTFVGVDPSVEMLGVCRDSLAHAGFLDRCDLIHGYVEQAPTGPQFDAVLSILVAHFIGREDRLDFYRNIHDRLKLGGSFVSTEICYDLDAAEFPAILKNWESVQALMGATPESLQALPDTLRDMLCVLSPTETEEMLRKTGFELPIQFFQAFLLHGWYAKK